MDGQLKLKQAKVLLVGTGGLGAPLGLYLAAAGVGRIGLVDFDVVDATNLQRQVIHGTKDIGRKKLDSAAERMLDINPHIRIDRYEVALSSENALEILRDYDIVVDGTDNFPTRYLVNDACVLLGRPNVSGAILRFEGQVSVFDPRQGPCYRCLHPEPPGADAAPSCAEAGVLGVLPGLVAMVQATEVVKLVAGVGDSLAGRLLHYDALDMRFTEFGLVRDPDCPVCGKQPRITALADVEPVCATPEEDDAMITERSVQELKELRDRGEEHLLLDVREPDEWEIARIEGARLLPLGELEGRVAELGDWRERLVVVHCHHGGRSARACQILQQHGFTRVENLRGGIEAWSQAVDPSVPRY